MIFYPLSVNANAFRSLQLLIQMSKLAMTLNVNHTTFRI